MPSSLYSHQIHKDKNFSSIVFGLNIFIFFFNNIHISGPPGLVDRLFPIHAGSRRLDSNQLHLSERFFGSNRPGYPHPVCSELENSGFTVAVGDCYVTERWRWRPPHRISLIVLVHAKTLQTQRGQTHGVGCALPWFRTAEPHGERRYEKWITTTTLHTYYT